MLKVKKIVSPNAIFEEKVVAYFLKIYLRKKPCMSPKDNIFNPSTNDIVIDILDKTDLREFTVFGSIKLNLLNL